MKKLFTILTVVVLTTTVSFSQFGLKAGTNMANITSSDDETDYGMKIGLIFGANYRAQIAYNMSLDVSATFKQSGTKVSYSESSTGGGITVKNESSGTMALNYLDISPSLSFNLSDAMSLSFGPYLAFAVSGKTKSESTLFSNNVHFSFSSIVNLLTSTLQLDNTGAK